MLSLHYGVNPCCYYKNRLVEAACGVASVKPDIRLLAVNFGATGTAELIQLRVESLHAGDNAGIAEGANCWGNFGHIYR